MNLGEQGALWLEGGGPRIQHTKSTQWEGEGRDVCGYLDQAGNVEYAGGAQNE